MNLTNFVECPKQSITNFCRKAFANRKAIDYMKNETGPCAYSWQADCTPGISRYRVSVKDPELGWVRREGDEGVELLLQKGWVLGPPSQGGTCLPVLSEPINAGGTSAWHYATAATTVFPVLRSLTRNALRIHHCCLDGGALSTARLIEQYNQAYYQHSFNDGERALNALTTFFLVNVCALHVCNGGIRWSNYFVLPEDKELAKGFLRIVHCALAAMRRGYSLLGQNLIVFLEMIVWRDSTDSVDEVKELILRQLFISMNFM